MLNHLKKISQPASQPEPGINHYQQDEITDQHRHSSIYLAVPTPTKIHSFPEWCLTGTNYQKLLKPSVESFRQALHNPADLPCYTDVP